MELLTNIGIDNLSPYIVKYLRTYLQHNDRAAEAVELFERIDESYRDWSWYYRKGLCACLLAHGESYHSEHVQQALQLIETAMKKTKRSTLRKTTELVL